jgi:hypothetical protein
MEQGITNRCLKVMETLATHPIYEMFAQAVDPERDEAPGYLDVIAKPMDLGLVRTKLENNQYTRLSEWKEDVNLTFANAISYNGKNSPVGVVACELQSIFRQLVKTLTDSENLTWFNELLHLRREICDHVSLRSQVLFGHTHSHISARKQNPTVVESNPVIKRLLVNSMPRGDLQKLASNLALLGDSSEIEQISAILQRSSCDVNEHDDRSIDLNLLAPETLRELKEFAVSALSLRGKSY